MADFACYSVWFNLLFVSICVNYWLRSIGINGTDVKRKKLYPRCSNPWRFESRDIIIFEHEGSTMVKRIAAVGGETIEADGKIYTVPKGRLFVLGDNKQNSFDSRYWEEPFVDEANVIAKVIGK